jgi:hypothetical protein
MEKAAIEDIIRKALVCRLGLCDGDRPYVVPLSFGYRDGVLYFHGGAKGTKARILRKSNNVCFEMDVDVALSPSDEPCRCGLKYRSVIGQGKAYFIDDPDGKRDALNVIMGQYVEGTYEFSDEAVRRTTVFRVEIESMTGKQRGY